MMPQDLPQIDGRVRWLLKKIVSISKKIFSVLKIWFIVPLAAALIGTTIISRIAGRILAPNSYKIYVVGNMDKSTAAQQFAQTFDTCELREFQGVPLDVVKRNDEGDPVQASRLAQSIAAQPDTLLVIGHFASGQTKEALPKYLDARPPIPVILATETTPNLVPLTANSGEYVPVLHLWPTDKEQARVAAHFIAKRIEKSDSKQNAVWVVQDISGDNVYSEFLANEFIRDVQKRNTKVVLWSTNLSIPSAHALHALNVGFVFFAGDWPAALIFIRELNSVYMGSDQTMPEILLSDACVDQQLVDEGGKDVDKVFLTFPMKASHGSEEYSAQAKNVCGIVRTLLREADYTPDVYSRARKDGGLRYLLWSLLGIKRVGDSRLLLSSRIQFAEDQAEHFTVRDGKLRFARKDADGELGARTDPQATFYIWRIGTPTNERNTGVEEFADFDPKL